MRPGRATDADARAVVLQALRLFDTAAFRVDPKGPRFAALKAAERRGWVWFREADRAAVTVDGQRAVADYLPDRA